MTPAQREPEDRAFGWRFEHTGEFREPRPGEWYQGDETQYRIDGRFGYCPPLRALAQFGRHGGVLDTPEHGRKRWILRRVEP